MCSACSAQLLPLSFCPPACRRSPSATSCNILTSPHLPPLQVSASVLVNDVFVEAEPYTSSGTSYSQFLIVQTAPGAFAVTRKVT